MDIYIHREHRLFEYYKNAAIRKYCLVYLALAMRCSYPIIAAVNANWDNTKILFDF